MRNIFKKSSLIVIACLLATTTRAEQVTVNLALAKNSDPNPPVGTIIGDNFNKSNFDGTGYKISNDGNSIGWNISATGKVIKSASFNGYINTTNTSKNWGIAFSTNGGQTWGSELTQANDGTKSYHNINVTVTIPSGANAIKSIRRAGTTTYVAGITLNLGYQNPVTGVTMTQTSLTLIEGASSQLSATVSPSNATHPNLVWTSSDNSVATVDNTGNVTALEVGTATITATTEDGGFTATCLVTVNVNPNPVAVTGVTLNKTSTTIYPGNDETLIATVQPNNATKKAVTWSSSDPSVATVDVTGKVHALVNGYTTITVTTVNGGFTDECVVEVSDVLPMPATTLDKHEPGMYEASSLAGGYNTPMTPYQQHAYEVFYCLKGKVDGSGVVAAATTPDGAYITDANKSAGWFVSEASSMEESGASAMEEFVQGTGNWKMKDSERLKLHVKGYDMFRILAADNDASNTEKQFHVYLNTAEKTATPSATPSIRSYVLNPSKEYLIEVEARGGSQMKLYGFSLREGQVPFTKHLKGNDSTQVILQTTAMRPITYYTKYNSIAGAETKLEWDGQEATGISLQPRGQGAVGDTLVVTGTANCPTGVYNFHINTYFNNTLTGSLPGKITVQSDIKALTETYAEGYQGMSIDDINFSYHALSADDITLSWKNDNAPDGINGSGSEGIYSISGTPTSTGTFIYTVTVLGGNSITDTLVVKASTIGDNAILYLYKNTKAYDKDGVYQYMTGSRNLFPLKATSAGKRAQSEYNKFKWILISQDVDANNLEIIELIQSRTGLPILNLNGFTYGKDEKRLGWGDPNNGAVDADKNRQGCSITIEQSGHPIFSKMSSPTDGKTVKIVDQYAKNGVMPIDVNNMPSDIASLCLATAHTRGVGYYEEGPLQTAIHEIPPVQGHSKYICLPLAREVTLTAEGKKLIDGIIDYLLSPTPTTVKAPTLLMNSFAVAGHSATIDQTNDLIVLSLTEKEYKDKAVDSLKAVTPVITVDDPKTHVVPGADEVLDLRFANYITKTFVVTDYVNRRPYTLQLTITKPQGIDEVYTAGQWVNIFDIYGRKVATTNEDVYTMELPHGMYIVVTENGGTIKIMR